MKRNPKVMYVAILNQKFEGQLKGEVLDYDTSPKDLKDRVNDDHARDVFDIVPFDRREK
jgi:hypothetical protein